MNTYQPLQDHNLSLIASLYRDYYNHQGGCWTFEKAEKRLHQYMVMEDSLCLVQVHDEQPSGVCIGYFKEFDDYRLYFLEEILIFEGYQRQGLGKELFQELSRQVKSQGAQSIELLTLTDEQHEGFYGSLGLNTSKRLVLKYIDFKE